jgi:hypothetical protein
MKATPRLIDQRQSGESCDPRIGAEDVVDRLRTTSPAQSGAVAFRVRDA